MFFDPHISTSHPPPHLTLSSAPLLSLSPLATATVTPDSSWYRPNPNTYQNTTVNRINKSRTDISLKFPNGTMTVSNATRTSFEATTDYLQSYVLINNTMSEMANKNLSFTRDGINYAYSTADSKGFVSFNYTGTWSPHTFAWVLPGNVSYAPEDIDMNGVINNADFNSVISNLTLYIPCPRCDVNNDTRFDMFDSRAVSKYLGG